MQSIHIQLSVIYSMSRSCQTLLDILLHQPNVSNSLYPPPPPLFRPYQDFIRLVGDIIRGVEGWGGGVLHQIFGSWVQHATKIETQSDLRFCKNEGWNRFKINEKGGQLDWKSRRKLIQNAYNLLNNTFWWNIRPTLGPSISGTKDKPIFFLQKQGANWIVLRYKIGTQSMVNPQNRDPHSRTSLPTPCMGVPTLGNNTSINTPPSDAQESL